MTDGESLDMGFVDNGAVPRRSGRGIGSPGESRIYHNSLQHARRAIPAVKREVLVPVSDLVTKMGIVPLHRALNLLGIGVEQQLVAIEP